VQSSERTVRAEKRMVALLLYLDEKKDAVTAECRAARERVNQSRKIYQELFDAYVGDMALVLAEMLEEGRPGPVCGSTHHVALAQPTAESVPQERVREANITMRSP
jgi:hypothetical protein